MTGIIDVGGGMKCAYSAGLYDSFLDNGIKFDYYLGVSAGSMNLLSFIAGERGRNIQMYRNSAEGDEYLSVSNFVHTGAYMNYKKVREEVYSDTGDNAFDYNAFFSSGCKFTVSVTDADSGDTVYFDRKNMKDRETLLDIISASCCLPIVSKPQLVDGKYYFDGGLAEPVPFRKAFDDGCDKLVVVMSTSVDKKRERMPGMNIVGPAVLRAYPNVSDVIDDRPVIYNYMIRCLKEYEREGKVIIFSPNDIPGAFSLIKNVDVVNRLYANGFSDGEEYAEKLKEFIKG